MNARGRGYVVVLGAALFAAACWHTKRNPEYCTSNEDCVAVGRASCDLVTHACSGVSGGDLGDDLSGPDLAKMCTTNMGCTMATAPVCGPSGTCQACAAKDCAGAKPSCATTGALSGACVECLDESGCATSQKVCNPVTLSCVACTAHTQCGSGICDAGVCIKAMDIAYVNNSMPATCATGDGTKNKPYCQVNTAIATGKSFVSVAGSATTYNAISVSGAGNVNVTIVGPGKSATMTAQFSENNAPSVNVDPTGGAAKVVVVDGLELIGSSVGAVPGVRCAITAGTASVTARDNYIHASGGLGVTSTGCMLRVERNLITDNKGGVSVLGGTYAIENNLIYLNVSAASPAVNLDNLSMGSFRFNTLAKNTAGAGRGGIECGAAGAKLIESSIIVGSMPAGAQVGTQCTLSNVVTGGTDGATGNFAMTPVFKSATDFHLITDAANTACCVNKAPTPTPALTLDVDNTLRPKGGLYDIGAHELE